MDMNSLIGTLMSGESINGLGKAANVNAKDVQSVLTSALPALLNGAQAQSQGKESAAGFASALAAHGKDDVSDLTAFLGKVDL
ncbi:MAG: hypothetical protein IKN53_01665, partial [Oscillibacter sp.]|nr:hypothetical protein [Oscillibacter sp.]